MCFGGGSKQYNAYDSGDYQNWKSTYDKQLAVKESLAKGDITQAQADQQLAALPDTSSLLNKVSSDANANMDAREVQRQGDISLGQIGIDNAFKQFDQPYYDQYKNDYTNYYYPQLEDQYDKAIGKTTAALAGRGMLESTSGFNTLGNVTQQNNQAKTDIANQATDAANKLKSSVQQEKSNLYSLNESSADPQAVNAQAVGSATALVAPPTYSPLGQVFADTLSSLNTYQQAKNNVPTVKYVSPYSTSYGSGSVVN